MFHPKLGADAHRALDARLEQMHAALTATPALPYDVLAPRTREVLTSVETRLVNAGRGEESGRWDWASEWLSDGRLTWGRFGDVDHDETAKALHAAFTEMVRFSVDATTPFRQQKYARQLADAVADYLGLCGDPATAPAAPPARAPRPAAEAREDRIMAILQTLKAAGKRLQGRELARNAALPSDRAGGPNSKIRQLLAEMVREGLLVHSEDGYGIGLKGRPVVG